MRHFGHLAPEVRASLFLHEPVEFTRHSPPHLLAVALGATLYCPASRRNLACDVVKQAARGVVSMVLCLEDAIHDSEVSDAEDNLVTQLALLADRRWRTDVGAPADDEELPLLFVRVRTPAQVPALVRRLGPAARLLSGFVLPKFTGDRGAPFLDAVDEAETASRQRLFVMPVLESPELVHLESRTDVLAGIARLLEQHRERVLALRLGVTDLCSAYGLRRSPDMTAYDIALVSSVIADVVNTFGRADGTGYTITGPVWEYFHSGERVFKPQLRATPFTGRAEELRSALIAKDMDGLMREILLDKTNGLQGKTCIHPSHVTPVHTLSVVTHEEYSDAVDILHPERDGGGVLRSAYTNKMNEVKPHRAWAERTMLRAKAFGVAREGVDFVELLAAGGA